MPPLALQMSSASKPGLGRETAALRGAVRPAHLNHALPRVSMTRCDAEVEHPLMRATLQGAVKPHALRNPMSAQEPAQIDALALAVHKSQQTCAIPVDFSSSVKPGGKKLVKIYDQNVLLMRNEHGQLSALNDECPHLGASLSQGCQEGARITCCYHGRTYDATGACVSYPKSAAATTYDVSEANGLIFAGPRGFGDAATEIPFMEELAEAGFEPSVRRQDAVKNHFSLIYENIVNVEHLVGVHKMPVDARNVRMLDSKTVEFEQPYEEGSSLQRFTGDDHLVCRIKMRPPYASFVEMRRPNSELEGRGQRGQIFMFAVPVDDKGQSRLLTVYRQNVVQFSSGKPKFPSMSWFVQHEGVRKEIMGLVNRFMVAPQVLKAIEEDRVVIEAQKYYTPAERRAKAVAGQHVRKNLEATKAIKPRTVVFGATGGTGRAIVQELLDAGHSVTAFVRNPAALKIKHVGLSIIRGDVMDAGDVTQAVAGHEAVVVALGVSKKAAKDVCSRGTQIIIDAMEQTGVKRMMCVSAYGVGAGWSKLSPMEKFFYNVAMGPQLKDKAIQESAIRASSLDWTILQPRQLTQDKPGTLLASGEFKTKSPSVSRKSVAKFAAQALVDDAAKGRSFALSETPKV